MKLLNFPYLFAFIIIAVFFNNINCSNEENGKEILSAKDSIQLGINGIADLMRDPRGVQEALKDLNNPEIMKEVKELMNDPVFKKEMEMVTNNPKFKEYQAAATELYQNPEKRKQLYNQLSEVLELQNNEMTDAQLGMHELQKAAKNPKLLSEALEMLKDPNIAREVKEMMNNPEFISEMNKYTSSKAFQDAKAAALEYTEDLYNDPVKFKQMETLLQSK